MKYYDENDVEIQESDIDRDKGRLEYDTKVIKHHEAVPEVQEESHYEVGTFYFEDGTSLTVESQDDPHIRPIDADNGVFEYVDQGEGKTLRGIDLVSVIDVQHEEAKDAYDETEEFYRFIPFTEEELEQRRIEEEEHQKVENFMSEGPGKLESLTEEVNNLNSDIAGVHDFMEVTPAQLTGLTENFKNLTDNLSEVQGDSENSIAKLNSSIDDIAIVLAEMLAME